MVCLVNGNTASAAELFAATLRTMNGARLVGTTTMGKGTIQSSPQRLSDGSAVVITVAKLVCGDGSCFDGTGLTVDVERALSTEEATNFYDYIPPDRPAGTARCQRCPAAERHHYAGRRKLCSRSGQRCFLCRSRRYRPRRSCGRGDCRV